MQNRKTINNYLGNRGLSTLDDPRGLVQQLGFMVEGHDHFKQMINKCPPQERRNMYEALRPHLRFEPKPLDVYVSELGMEAEAQKLPTLDVDGKLHEYRPAEIQTVVRDVVEETLAQHHLVLECRKCTKTATFHGGRKVDAISNARQAGWTYGLNQPAGSDEIRRYEICPDCPGSN